MIIIKICNICSSSSSSSSSSSCGSDLVLASAAAELDSHDPVGAGTRSGAFLPHSDVRIVVVEPKASEGRRRVFAALPQLNAKQLRKRLRAQRCWMRITVI
ncbi:hypothetical protein PanWU01x14_342180 [Parasponia andersonii]|uniref:Uncharacterized protein n=1 Tax=Parasponia andersonii TaxID=3476 RepID=A0A2P5ADU1_PARAD|nr:hypothetical protein PanWU01x14_342180 [Parasponia andersonii]